MGAIRSVIWVLSLQMVSHGCKAGFMAEGVAVPDTKMRRCYRCHIVTETGDGCIGSEII